MIEVPYVGNLAGYGNHGDAGIDLYVGECTTLYAGEKKLVGTGCSAQIPEGHFGMLVPRSSTGKLGLVLANTIGIIDYGYVDEIKMFLKNVGSDPVHLSRGDRVCQLIVVPFVSAKLMRVASFDNPDDRGGGFGTTGR